MKRSMINALALAVILAGMATTGIAGGIGAGSGVKANLISTCGKCNCDWRQACTAGKDGSCSCG